MSTSQSLLQMSNVTDDSQDSERILVPDSHCLQKVRWYWAAQTDCSSSNIEWHEYADEESRMIEEAFIADKALVELDDGYTIDLKEQIQYNELDHQQKQPVRRIASDACIITNVYLREDRFSSLVPLAPISSAEVIQKAEKNNIRIQMLRNTIHFPATYLWFLTPKTRTFSEIVEEAIQGILNEGIDHGVKHKAEWLTNKLRTVKHYGDGIDRLDDNGIPDQIGRMCITLYTSDSFLYRVTNAVLRDIDNITQESLKRLGPFSALLAFYLEQIQTSNIDTVYRGLNCTDEERSKFMSHYVIHFSAFTSTSTSRALASIFGNTLLIIQPNFYSRFSRKIRSYGVDIRNLSNFPQEEEFLIYPAALFEFIKHEFDNDTNQHLIYLKAFDSGTI